MKGTRLSLKKGQAKKLTWMLELTQHFHLTDTVWQIRDKLSYLSWNMPDRGIAMAHKIRRPTAAKLAKKFAAIPKSVFSVIADKPLGRVLRHIELRGVKRTFEAIFMIADEGLFISVTNLTDEPNLVKFFLSNAKNLPSPLPYTVKLEPQKSVDVPVLGPAGHQALVSAYGNVLARIATHYVKKTIPHKGENVRRFVQVLGLNKPEKRVVKPAAVPAPVLSLRSMATHAPNSYQLPPVYVKPYDVPNYEWGAPEYPIAPEYPATG